MAAHSSIGASSMSRWSKCPGSVRLSAGIESKSSSYAEEGSAAHALAELCLIRGVAPRAAYLNWWVGRNAAGAHFLVQDKPEPNEVVFVHQVTEEMAEAMGVYVSYVQGLHSFPWTTLALEQRVDLSALHPGLFGTADAVVYRADTRTLDVVDYKHGAGVPVEVQYPDGSLNPQLLYYALGALMQLGKPVSDVRLTVVQPRCAHPQGPIRTATVRASWLMLNWAQDLVEAAQATERSDAPVHPGDHCRWCPAAATCPALVERAQALAKEDFAVPDGADALAEAMGLIPGLEAWIKAVRERAYEEAAAGRPPAGWKLVPKRAIRKWRDEDEVAAALLKYGMDDKDLYSKALKTPAQIEKALGKANAGILEPYVVKESSGMTLAPETDDRQPITRRTAREDFAE